MESLTSNGTDDLRSLCARAPPCLIGTARTIRVEAGKTLVIVGPASFELAEGEASILGAPLNSARNIVPRGKQTPVEIHSLSSFRISLGEHAGVEELDGSTIPLSWREAGSALVELGEGIAVVDWRSGHRKDNPMRFPLQLSHCRKQTSRSCRRRHRSD